MELYTWLLAMQPRSDTLLAMGLEGVRRSARMTIDDDRLEQIMQSFTVPDLMPNISVDDPDTNRYGTD